MNSQVERPSIQIIDYCKECKRCFRSDEKECQDCLQLRKQVPRYNEDNQPFNYFVKCDLKAAVQQFMKHPNIQNLLNYRNNWDFHSARKSLKDIFDGKLYRTWYHEKKFLCKPQNISFTLNTDGISPQKSLKCHIWPVYLVVNELPPNER